MIKKDRQYTQRFTYELPHAAIREGDLDGLIEFMQMVREKHGDKTAIRVTMPTRIYGTRFIAEAKVPLPSEGSEIEEAEKADYSDDPAWGLPVALRDGQAS